MEMGSWFGNFFMEILGQKLNNSVIFIFLFVTVRFDGGLLHLFVRKSAMSFYLLMDLCFFRAMVGLVIMYWRTY